MIEASCHCGAVKMRIAKAPPDLTDCNCSICRRYGTLWAYYAPEEVEFTAGRGKTQVYQHGTKELEFHRCATCGCVTHWEPADKSNITRIGVNARLWELADREGIRVRRFDGADTWMMLD